MEDMDSQETIVPASIPRRHGVSLVSNRQREWDYFRIASHLACGLSLTESLLRSSRAYESHDQTHAEKLAALAGALSGQDDVLIAALFLQHGYLLSAEEAALLAVRISEVEDPDRLAGLFRTVAEHLLHERLHGSRSR